MNIHSQHLGRYELRELLGRGGIAEVWKAFDLQLHHDVIIKLFRANLTNDPHFLARFEHEAPLVASLHHPNIIQVRDFQISRPSESESTFAYFVLDYVEGPQLVDYIRTTAGAKQFPSRDTLVQLFVSISSALDYAHQH